ncbi:hypothetical protein EVA_13000 [gut metagenome]|uniref:Uncharacterized protein n=1 Tax=gut metagenome TaxID=749906 RepID=J9GAT6_9ZZZZ
MLSPLVKVLNSVKWLLLKLQMPTPCTTPALLKNLTSIL